MLPSFKIQNLQDTAQSNVPVTFGHVFAPGDLPAGRGLLAGASDGTYMPLQVDAKAMHPDGSVRHAILSAVVPAIGGKGTRTYRLLDADKRTGTMAPRESHATVELVVGGVDYVAKLDTPAPGWNWLSGPMVLEQKFAVPFVAANGAKHPHLMARFAVRDYGTSIRFDVTVENNWAFEPGPQNFKYDATVSIGGLVVYSKPGLTHLTHARWRKIFWMGIEPKVNVQVDSAYLIASRAVPNYDMSFPPSEGTLKRLAVCALSGEPMQIGAASPYFPTTGANEEIGILPMWDTAWIMSQDSRARDCVLVTGNGAGSYPVHYRDKDTDLPVSLSNYPYMTIAGNPGDTWNEKKKRLEKFPAPGGDTTSPFTPDEAHQPSLAYTAYLATGDYYYIEEMQFWAMWNSFWDNPNYRGAGLGLIIAGELRAQAWALRTIAQAAFITPDDHPLKADLLALVRNNLAWYTNQYVGGPGDNKIGVPTHGGSIAHDAGLSIAPWMHDYFVGVLGHLIDLGFVEAKPFLLWMCRFTIGRMVGPGICWVLSAQYDLQIRDSLATPVYDSLVHSYNNRAGVGPKVLALPCAGPEMAAAVGRPVRDMGNISDGNMGYPAWMQPAISAAVDAGYPNADVAFADYMSRSIKPDFTQGAHFAILPHEPISTTPPDQGNAMTYKITIAGFDSAPQQLAAGSEASLTSIRSRIMSPDGAKVLSESATLPHVLGGLDAGIYPVEIAALDSTGAVMGKPAIGTVDTATAPVVVPPAQPITVSLPSAIQFSVEQEQ